MLSHIWRASRSTLVSFVFFSCFLLALNAQVQDNAAAVFKFSDVDRQVLDQSNAIDAQYVKKGLLLQDPDLQAYLDSVGKRVLGNRPIPEQVQFKFRVLRDPMVQAFALPNGSVYVTTGLLSLLENEAQLAGVLGHETAHVFERHGYFENRSVRKKALTLNVIQIVASAAPVGPNFSQSVQLFGQAVQLGAAIGSEILVASIFGYSREMERQADSDGLQAMTEASYDPAAMARSFELLDEDSKLEFEPFQSFYHDHPKLSDRRVMAGEYASAHTPAQPVTGTEKDYLSKVSPAVCADIEADLNSRRERTAVNRATRLTTIFPDSQKYRVLLADSYRGLGAKARVPSDDEHNRHGQAEHRKEYFSMTPQEEQKKLLEKPEGPNVLLENRSQAETLYKSVLQADPTYSQAHRGLGFLYEDEGKYAEAAAEYQAYLAIVAGTSLDHLRIERRLVAMQKMAGSPVSR
jgi:predicted Zn-dependent protease